MLLLTLTLIHPSSIHPSIHPHTIQWPSFIRKNGCVANMRAHSAFAYNVFDDHVFNHDIYAAARFLKWLGQMLKVRYTLSHAAYMYM